MKAVKTTVLVTMSLCAVIAYAQNAPRTSDTSADEAALLAADDAFTRAFASGDLEAMVALYAEDAVLLPEDAPAAKGREAIREYYRLDIARRKKAGELGEPPSILSDRAVGVSGDLGWSSGHYPGGKYLSVSRKMHGKWLYIRDTSNSDSASR